MAVPPPGPTYPTGYAPRPQIRFDVIGEAWRLFQPQMSTWIVAELVLIAGIIVAAIVSMVLSFVLGAALAAMARVIPFAPIGMLFALLIPFLVIFPAVNVLLAGLYNMALKQIRGEAIAVGDMFAVNDRLGPLIVASLATAVITWLGLFVCGIGAWIAGAMLMFTIPLIVDRRMDGIDAMKLSFETLKPDIVMATLFFVVVAFVGGIGGVAFGIGALLTWPLFFLSIALLYRDFFLVPVTAAPGYPSAPVPPSSMTPTVPPTPPATYAPPATTTPPTPATVAEVSAEPVVPPAVAPEDELPPATPPAEPPVT